MSEGQLPAAGTEVYVPVGFSAIILGTVKTPLAKVLILWLSYGPNRATWGISNHYCFCALGSQNSSHLVCNLSFCCAVKISLFSFWMLVNIAVVSLWLQGVAQGATPFNHQAGLVAGVVMFQSCCCYSSLCQSNLLSLINWLCYSVISSI